MVFFCGVLVESLWGIGAGRCVLSFDVYKKHFSFKKLKPANFTACSAEGNKCIDKVNVELLVEIRSLKMVWTFYVIEGLTV